MFKLTKKTNYLISFFLYMVLAIAVIAAGRKIIFYSINFNFYTNYLLKWERALITVSSRDLPLPHFSGKNHVQYMDNVVKLMEGIPVEVPKSNTGRAYIYRLKGKGISQGQDIFLLCLEKKIILYGLPKTTFNMLDKNIDGQVDRNKGRFKGKLQKGNEYYVGIWEL